MKSGNNRNNSETTIAYGHNQVENCRVSICGPFRKGTRQMAMVERIRGQVRKKACKVGPTSTTDNSNLHSAAIPIFGMIRYDLILLLLKQLFFYKRKLQRRRRSAKTRTHFLHAGNGRKHLRPTLTVNSQRALFPDPSEAI